MSDADPRNTEAEEAKPDSPSRDDAISQAIEQVGGTSIPDALRNDLQAEAERQYRDGMSVAELSQAVNDARAAARSNSDPKTWPEVTGKPPPETEGLGAGTDAGPGVATTQQPSLQEQQGDGEPKLGEHPGEDKGEKDEEQA